MQLDEGIVELRDNLLRDEAELASGPEDHLWTDDTLVRYMDFIQKLWARKTLTLRDDTTVSLVQVPLVEGKEIYTLHPAVRAVITAKYDTDGFDLTRAGHSMFAGLQVSDPLYFDVNDARATPGRPLLFSTDEGLKQDDNSAAIQLRVYPAPNAEVAGKLVKLRVARMPLIPLSLDNLKATFEVPEVYHLNLLDGVAWRCFRTADVDGASSKADGFKKEFEEAMAQALKEQRSKMFQPVRWSFGRAGYTWSP